MRRSSIKLTLLPEIGARPQCAALVLLDDLLGELRRELARGTRSSPASPARRRTRRGTRLLRRSTSSSSAYFVSRCSRIFGPARDEARHVRAHRHEQPAARTALEHRVEGTRPLHDRGRLAGELAISSIASGDSQPVLVLREVRERQDRRLRPRVLRDDLACACARFASVKKLMTSTPHRSTSPMIGSMLDTIATASATRLPSVIGSVACRL